MPVYVFTCVQMPLELGKARAMGSCRMPDVGVGTELWFYARAGPTLKR